ncbi:MAG: 16S rRNA (guanine(966)-N(2))-methyltransferase RsmD [Planctomycetota bacterium]
MRIISGARKGKQLQTLEGLDTRPTPDLVKGAVFNIIRPRVQGARVLDVFSGTGTLGIEALSCGAKHASFVEGNLAAVALLKRNLHGIQAERVSAVYALPAGKALKQMEKRGEQFEIVFLDPPFAFLKDCTARMKDDFLSMGELIAVTRELLAPGGLLVLRYESGDALPTLAGFAPLSARSPARRYGRSTIALCLRDDAAGAEYVFPRDEDFRGHRPKNMEQNVARRRGGAEGSESEDGSDDEAGGDGACDAS